MDQIIDSCIWVDHLRPNTKPAVRLLAEEIISRPSIALCEPIKFELLRLAPQTSQGIVENMLSTVPVLTTPISLWHQATRNGQQCRAHGIQTGSMDLLISTICQHHRVKFVAFDAAFEKIAKILKFSVELVKR